MFGRSRHPPSENPGYAPLGVDSSQCLSVSYEPDIDLLIPWCGPQHVGVEPSQCLSVSYEPGLGLLIPWCGPQHVGVEPSQCLSVSYEPGLGLLIPWCGPQHVGIEPSQCLSVSYEYGLGLLIPWCGPQHVGVEPSQCLSVSYEYGLGLLIPWCGSQHVGLDPSQCLSVSYEYGLGFLIPWCGSQHVGVEPSQCLSVSYEHDIRLLIPWCGPQHLAYALRLAIDYAKSKNQKLYIVFVDFVKAYDKVARGALIRSLIKYGCGYAMILAIATMYSNTSMVLGAAIISATLGVRQGSPTSCFLFTCYLNDLVRDMKQCPMDGFLRWIHCLLLMDDTVLLATTREECRRKVRILYDFCQRSGMEMNQTKTKFMCINSRYSG